MWHEHLMSYSCRKVYFVFTHKIKILPQSIPLTFFFEQGKHK